MIRETIEGYKDLIVSPTAKRSYITTFGAFLNAFFGFVFTVLVARALTPEDFGIFSVLASFLLIILSFCDLGFSSAAMRFLPKIENEEKKFQFIKIVLSTVLVSNLIIVAALIFFSNHFSLFIFKSPSYQKLFLFLSPGILGLCFWGTISSMLYAQGKILKAIIADISAVVFKVILVAFLFLNQSLTLTTSILALSLTPFLSVILSVFFISFKFIFSSFDKKFFKEISSFAFFIFLSNIVIALLGQIDYLFLARLSGALETGIYSAANRLTFIFPAIVKGYTVILVPKFAGFAKKEEAKKFLKKVNFTFLISVLSIIVLFFLAQILVSLIYGSSYLAATPVFQYLLIRSAFFLLAIGPLTTLVYFFGESRLFTLISLTQLLILVFFDFLFIPRFGAAGPAFAGAISYGFVFLLSYFIVLRKFASPKN
jgi:O-antigen/teichoic acid export membrane protein